MASKSNSATHGVIFGLLVVLMLCSVGTHLLHLEPLATNLVLFTVAFLMAGLVVVQYMGLRTEGHLVKWLFVVPLILFGILVVLLLPDIAHFAVPPFLRLH